MSRVGFQLRAERLKACDSGLGTMLIKVFSKILSGLLQCGNKRIKGDFTIALIARERGRVLQAPVKIMALLQPAWATFLRCRITYSDREIAGPLLKVVP